MLYQVVIAFAIVGTSLCEIPNHLRGVPPQLVSHYKTRLEFECLDGSKKIAFDYVNDDYCDCDDGSDEPGTSACSNSHFYCPNAGFKPKLVPASNVNDNICDCCDGSDEWLSGTECPNVCNVQGEKWREEVKELRQIQEVGYAKRLELAKAGAKILEEKKSDLEKHRNELTELEPLKASLEAKKNAAEEKENEAKSKYDEAWNVLKAEYQIKRDNELFAQIDMNKDSKVDIADLEAFSRTQGDVSSDEIKDLFGDQNEFDIESFRTVSQKVRDLLHKIAEEAEEKKQQQEEQQTTEGSPDEGLPTPPPESEPYSVDDEVVEESHARNEDEPQRPPYDEVTQTLINEADAARKEFEEILRKISELENNVRNSESLMEFDFGPDYAWAPLKGQCAELNTLQYTYRLCMFDRTVQKDLNGYSEVNLGYWGGWAGPEENKYRVQKYDKGQSCWNGPERSTYVDIQCGAELQLVSASEPAKCEYHFVLKLPVACTNPANNMEHQEL